MTETGLIPPRDMALHPNVWVRDAARRYTKNKEALELIRLGQKKTTDETGTCLHTLKFWSWVEQLTTGALVQRWACAHCGTKGERRAE